MTTQLTSVEEHLPRPRIFPRIDHPHILPNTQASFSVAEVPHNQTFPHALPARDGRRRVGPVMGTAVLDVVAPCIDLSCYEAVAPPFVANIVKKKLSAADAQRRRRYNTNPAIPRRERINTAAQREMCSPRPVRSAARRRMMEALGFGADDANDDDFGADGVRRNTNLLSMNVGAIHKHTHYNTPRATPRKALKAGGCIILTDAFIETNHHRLHAHGRLRECLRWRRNRGAPLSPTTSAAVALAKAREGGIRHDDDDDDDVAPPRLCETHATRLEPVTARVRRYVQQVREHQRPLLRRLTSSRLYGRGYYYRYASSSSRGAEEFIMMEEEEEVASEAEVSAASILPQTS